MSGAMSGARSTRIKEACRARPDLLHRSGRCGAVGVTTNQNGTLMGGAVRPFAFFR